MSQLVAQVLRLCIDQCWLLPDYVTALAHLAPQADAAASWQYACIAASCGTQLANSGSSCSGGAAFSSWLTVRARLPRAAAELTELEAGWLESHQGAAAHNND